MKRTALCLVVLALVAIWAPVTMAQSIPPDDVKLLPRGQTEEEITNELNAPNGTSWPWECDPDSYGFTSTPGPDYRWPSEYESTAGVLIGWPSGICTSIPELGELVRVGLGRTDVTIVTSTRSSIETCLRGRGFTAEQIAQIKWAETPIPVNTIWIRDYGPEVVNAEDGTRKLIDMSYYPGRGNCNPIRTRPLDDVSPTRLTQLGGPEWATTVHRPQVRAEGGALQTDGAGTCFRTRRQTLAQNRFASTGGWQYSEEELDAVFSEYYNCSMVVLESMVGGVIDHIDMWMTVISPSKILVGQYRPEEDAMNAAIFDRNAATLEELGYTVVRVPMPPVYCSDGGFPQQPGRTRLCTSTYESRRVWATYVNSIQIGNAMTVPIYQDVPEDLRADFENREAEALAIFQRELNAEFGEGVIEVVPVNSDRMITGQGSLHCIAITYR